MAYGYGNITPSESTTNTSTDSELQSSNRPFDITEGETLRENQQLTTLPSDQPEIFNDNIIKLQKDVISNSKANQIYSRNFSKLAKSDEFVDQDKIVQKYDDLFYNIKIEGKDSHKTIVEQSYNYLYERYNRQLQNRIDKLIELLGTLGKELSDLQNPAMNEHPIYEDRSFLIAGINGEKYQDMHTVYIMQEGKKRAFNEQGESTIYMAVRRLFDLPEDFTGLYYVDLNSLNNIDDGKNIDTLSDLHIKGAELAADYDDVLGISAYTDVMFTCKGNEVWDELNLVLGDDPDKVAQYYLNDDPCKIYYLKDEYVNDETGPEVVELILSKGQSESVRLLREIYLEDDEGFGLNNLPNNIQTYYDQYSNPDAEILYNGQVVSNYVKNWGPGTRYASVVYAEGRIMSRELDVPALNNEFFTQDTSTKIFNGLPTAGSEGFQIVDMPDNLGEQFFNGVRRIYQPGSKYWGALNQSMDFQNTYFNDPNFGYYRSVVRKSNGINLKDLIRAVFGREIANLIGDVYIFRSKALYPYGQPIIRAYSKNVVIVGTQSYGITINLLFKKFRLAFEYVVFYDCDSGEIFAKTKGSADDTSANIKLNMSDGFIQSIQWNNINTDQVRYIGHKGAKVYGYGSRERGNDNPYNPKDGGSNYELNGVNGI